MGPIHWNPTFWPPVEPADRPVKAGIALQGDKDRRIERHLRRRRQQGEESLDADEFRHREELEEKEDATG